MSTPANDSAIYAISVIAPVATLVLTVVIFSIIGHGWSGLVRRHPLHHPARGDSISGVSGRVNGIMYKRCLTLHVTNEGFSVSSFFPFSLLQKPFFIRWSQVEALQHVRITGFRRLELRIRNETFSLFFHGNTETAIVAVAQQHQLTVKD